MKKSALFLFLVSFFIQANAQCILNDTNVYKFNSAGHSYWIVKENKTWVDASACAKAKGGYLAEINSDSEQIILNNKINSNANITAANTVAPDGGGASYLWLGGTDRYVEGNWNWDGDNDSVGILFFQGKYPTGVAVSGNYIHWGSEPDDFGNAQDGLGLAITDWPLGTAGHWNDLNPNNTLYYVIEFNSLTGLKQVNHSEISIYPNPACNELNLEWNNTFTKRIQLFDATGHRVYLNASSETSHHINTESLAAGLYSLIISDPSGQLLLQQKVIIAK